MPVERRVRVYQAQVFLNVPYNRSYVFPLQAVLTADANKRATHSTYFGRTLRLGIEGKSLHCLRPTFASRRAAHGDTIDEIRIRMGHTAH